VRAKMEKDDVLGYFFDKTKEVTVITVMAILDVVEESFDCMTVATGKNLIKVCFATYAFVPLILILQVMGKTTVVHIIDAVIASAIITFIWAINNITDSQVKSSVDSMRNMVSKMDVEKIKNVTNKVKAGENRHG